MPKGQFALCALADGRWQLTALAPLHLRAVGDRDLCLLNTMVYESPDSSGSNCQGGIYNQEEGVCIPLPPYAVRSGPRRDIYFDPDKVGAWTCPRIESAGITSPRPPEDVDVTVRVQVHTLKQSLSLLP